MITAIRNSTQIGTHKPLVDGSNPSAATFLQRSHKAQAVTSTATAAA